jgi:hypothetical protein
MARRKTIQVDKTAPIDPPMRMEGIGLCKTGSILNGISDRMNRDPVKAGHESFDDASP